MNTIENNKLIAEFMGFDMIEGNKIISVIKDNQLKVLNPNNSWNWLMEVVEKIDYLERNTDSDVFIEKISKVTSLPLFTPIHTVYNACIEFIKWHTQQNTKP